MGHTMNLTPQKERVLRVFLEEPQSRRYGYELMRRAGLKSGTLYPMLGQFEAEGVLSADWEQPGEATPGRPPKRYYRLTGEGLRAARQALAESSIVQVQSRSRSGRVAPGAAEGLA